MFVWQVGRGAALTAIGLAVSACSNSAPPPGTSIASTATPLSTRSALPGPPSQSGPTCLSQPASLESLPSFALLDAAPDDLALDAAGNVWVSLRDANAILEVSSSGQPLHRFPDPAGPEGIAFAGGRLLVAQQLPNRIDVLDPSSGGLSPLISLPGAGGALGVDGIGVDPATGRLLVPDSPTGGLYSYAPDGSDRQTVATGLGRPVGVAAAGSTLYVAVGEPAGSGVDRWVQPRLLGRAAHVFG